MLVSLGSWTATNLDMFLQILRTFEAFAAHAAAVWFERNMDPDVTCDVIALDSLGVAVSPGTGQAQIISRLPSNVFLAQVILVSAALSHSQTYIEVLRLHKRCCAACPLTRQILGG
jgi:hypothetical protein